MHSKLLNGNLLVVFVILLVLFTAVGHAGEQFYGVSEFSYTIKDNQATITSYHGKASVLNIPDELDGFPVRAIGLNGFLQEASLTKVSIPATVVEIVGNPFVGCENLKRIDVAPDNPAFESDGGILYAKQTKTLITYPPGNTGKTCKIREGTLAIGDKAFRDCRVTNCIIPDSVLSIGEYAFFNCARLTACPLPNNLLSIGMDAFRDCVRLTKISIPASTNKIDSSNPFSGCERLKSINVSPDNTAYESDGGVLYDKQSKILICYPPSQTGKTYQILDGTMAVGAFSFDGSHLTDVIIPDSVRTIGEYAFLNSESLAEISIPAAVTEINGNPFYNCKKLQSINVSPDNPAYESNGGILYMKQPKTLICHPPDNPNKSYQIHEGTMHIGDNAFYSCVRLTEVTIPESVVSIGKSAFYRCKDLTVMIIPDSVASIGDSAFGYCTKLTSVIIPEGVTSIEDRLLSGCTGLTNVAIPEGVASIGDSSFWDCARLIEVTIPESVTSIGQCAFWGCAGLTEMTIPENVVDIGWFAFNRCEKLILTVQEGSYAAQYAKKNRVQHMFATE